MRHACWWCRGGCILPHLRLRTAIAVVAHCAAAAPSPRLARYRHACATPLDVRFPRVPGSRAQRQQSPKRCARQQQLRAPTAHLVAGQRGSAAAAAPAAAAPAAVAAAARAMAAEPKTEREIVARFQQMREQVAELVNKIADLEVGRSGEGAGVCLTGLSARPARAAAQAVGGALGASGEPGGGVLWGRWARSTCDGGPATPARRGLSRRQPRVAHVALPLTHSMHALDALHAHALHARAPCHRRRRQRRTSTSW